MVKKIAILLTSIPELGGEHQYLVLLMETLLKYNNIYFEVTPICCNRFWRKWCQENQIGFIRYKQEKYTTAHMELNAKCYHVLKIYNTYFSALGKIITENKIDLLIGGQQSTFLPALPCKLVQPVHDLMHRFEPGFEEVRNTYKERETHFSSSSRIVDVVLVDSVLGRRQYIGCYYRRGRHIPHIRVLPFATPDYREKFPEHVETPHKFLFYPAQFWTHKNHKNLLAAVSLLKEKIPDIHLVLVGSEKNSLQKIKKMIRDNALEQNVTIMGFVSDGQVMYLYQNAVALVMPTYFGPTNIPPLEAMALGCPVIASNKYAMPEQTGDAGLLFDPDSPEELAVCIERVWNDDELRRNMIAKGYEQSKKWTGEKFKKRFLNIVLDELEIHVPQDLGKRAE